MNITVNGRNVEITPALKSYSEEKIGKFDRYLSNISEAVVTLSVQKHRQRAEVLIRANGFLIQAESTTEELYSAIDEVADKLDRQIKKIKEKLSSHRVGENVKAKLAPHEAPEPADDEMGVIIKRKSFDMKPMQADEAAMQMEMLGKNFFVFTNAENSEINVLYKRTDGNYGLIEPVK